MFSIFLNVIQLRWVEGTVIGAEVGRKGVKTSCRCGSKMNPETICLFLARLKVQTVIDAMGLLSLKFGYKQHIHI